MATDLEVFTKFVQDNTEEFNKWSDSIAKEDEEKRIKMRLPFTITAPKVKFNDLEKKPFIDKKDGKSGTNLFKKFKFINSQGVESYPKLQLPSIIAGRGYCTLKTDKGEFKCIPVTFDLRNPDHKAFCEVIDSLYRDAIHEIMKKPGDFGKVCKSFPEITPDVLKSKEYEKVFDNILESMSRLLNFPKVNGDFDLDSHYRTMFLTPQFYQNPEKLQDPPVEMKVFIKAAPGEPPFQMSPSELYRICEGFEGYTEDGKEIKGDCKGFECSPEISFTKLNAGSKISLTNNCTAITITRFQAAKKVNSQENKSKYIDDHGVADEYTANVNLENLRNQLRKTTIPTMNEKKENAEINKFNPMDTDASEKFNNIPAVNTNSLMNILNSNFDEKTNQQHTNSINVPLMNNFNQQATQMPYPANTASFIGSSPTINSSDMPAYVGGNSIETSQQSFQDRLSTFQQNKSNQVSVNGI